ncbi:lytic polysaccharide monooxygenase [Paenibacillus sp. N1-5-1-14]|uniref:lytic polysaccharide monooxygenase n=1 Tax=Paenibacillus radicibacter TaxID=2972488 RepID=UPI0021591E62|nr:lytic polysaccharide monooxygenase [Paenibacillus radicibacter]MCR8643469.1 lytic polysaccharide monooxygenase [Paenibacillus radicibacter]
MLTRLKRQFTKSREGTNTSKRARRIATPLALVCGIIGSLAFAGLASAHGYVEGPKSRTLLCNQGVNTGCGPIQFEPQSVEGLKGFPNGGPGDGNIAGGGHYPELDVQTADRWKKVDINGGKNTFTWYHSARHATSKWEYYITKVGWNPNQPLKGSDFELLATFSGGGQQPAQRVSHDVNVPTDRSGYYIILSVWEVADTVNSFYQVIDVNLKNSNTNPPTDLIAPSVPTGVASSAQTANSVTLNWSASTDNVGVHHYELLRNGVKVTDVTGTTYTDSGLLADTSYTYNVKAVDAAGNASAQSTAFTVKTKTSSTTIEAWSATKVYVAGNQVTYQGVTYEAKWWTQGETPGTADVWKKI